MPETKSVLARLTSLEQRVDTLFIMVENKSPSSGVQRMHQRICNLENEISGCCEYDNDDSVLEDEDAGLEEEQTAFVIINLPPKRKAGRIYYLRESPLKAGGEKKWWTDDVSNAKQFITRDAAVEKIQRVKGEKDNFQPYPKSKLEPMKIDLETLEEVL